MLERLWQDVRFAARSLTRARGVALVAVISLAFGIGANATVFSLVQAVEFPSFIYPQASRIVFLESSNNARGGVGMPVSAPDALDIAAGARTLELATLTADQSSVLRVGDTATRVAGRRVGPEFFALFGVQAALGRVLGAGDVQGFIVISSRLWQSALGSNPAVVNRSVAFDGGSVTIVGVMPPRFDEDADVWTPLGSPVRFRRDDRQMTMFARLRADASITDADRELRQISARLSADHPGSNKDWVTYPVLLSRMHGRDSRGAFLLLQAAVGLVLLLACANIANVLLARGTNRRHEMAVRLSLGSTGGRLVRTLLIESVLLSAAGGAIGVLLAMWGIRAARAMGGFPDAIDPRLNPLVLAFTAAASIATGIICGIVPAVRAARTPPETALRADGKRGMSEARTRLRSVLVASQIAIALVLGASAALMVQSLVNRRNVDLGFDPSNAVRADLALPPWGRYNAPDATRAIAERIIDQIESSPDIAAAGAVTWALPTSAGGQRQLTLPDDADRGLAVGIPRAVEAVSPRYFAAMGAPLRSGREFGPADASGSSPVAIINEELARNLWPNRNPVGERLRLGAIGENVPIVTVVGVVGSIRRSGMHDRLPARVYVPFAQYPNTRMTLVVRARTDIASATRSFQAAVRRADPSLLLEGLRTVEADVAQFVAPIRMLTLLLTAFGIGGLLLAGLGVFGTMSYTVSQRDTEIAIRAALGATRVEILRLVLRSALTMTVAGIVMGTIAAYAVTNALRAFLFGVTPADPRTFAGMAATLIVLSLVAAYRPARTAASVDPMSILRR